MSPRLLPSFGKAGERAVLHCSLGSGSKRVFSDGMHLSAIWSVNMNEAEIIFLVPFGVSPGERDHGNLKVACRVDFFLFLLF